MARCGCSGTCACSFQPGTGIAIAGTGSASDPIIISATGTVDCATVRPCISAGDGAEYDPVTGVIEARLSTDVGNQIVFGGDGGLYNAGGGGGGGLVAVATTDSTCIDFSGNGQAGSPLTASPIVSPVAGNLLTCSAGGLRALLSVGACGLTGNGSAASPLAANVGAWAYPCSVDTFGGLVACDSGGRLRSEPRGMASFFTFTEDRSYANLTVPAGFDQPGDSFATSTTNPDTCRSSLVVVEREADVDFILPAGAGAAYGHATDEMYYTRNTGTTTINDAHVQTTKIFALAAMAAPGASIPLTFDVTLGRGTAAATYNRIQVFIRCLQISL